MSRLSLSLLIYSPTLVIFPVRPSSLFLVPSTTFQISFCSVSFPPLFLSRYFDISSSKLRRLPTPSCVIPLTYEAPPYDREMQLGRSSFLDFDFFSPIFGPNT
ncbi:hypothetical protein DEU56DRAFT_328326 [Suillus clintonianus]|uniref:uncharacterized protein n=1 Tax=Suillus clintonianus TaxID=1904413 RepID=UPI001B86267B|nr:uncharacterized protein DEU56DRAFT_328326 [Suillus clintonianus]KAG2138930.1 hypothetical protein DEU56DRAFT_328326 [Suillus clintonianus]